MRYGKLINNEIVYFRDSEIKLKTTIVDGKPVRETLTDEIRNKYISDNGYKEIVLTKQTASTPEWEEFEDKLIQIWTGEPVKVIKGSIPNQKEPITNEDKRKHSYATERIISFENKMITVDEANERFIQLFAEGSDVEILKQLIVSAKNIIRIKYPDNF